MSMDKNTDNQCNITLISRRVGETIENSDSNVEQVDNVMGDDGPSVKAYKSDISITSFERWSSSTSTDTLKDADDLLNELDAMLPSTFKVITENTASDNQTEEILTLRTAENDDDVHEIKSSAENTEMDNIDDRTRKVRGTDVDVEETVKVSKETQEGTPQINVLEAHGLTVNIIDTTYGSETEVTAIRLYPIPNTPIEYVNDDVLDNSGAVDLTQVLQTVKDDIRLTDETIWEKVDIDKSIRKLGSIVISVPSVITVTSETQRLPGEVFKASHKRKKVIVKKHTEIDNDDDGEIRNKKGKMKALKKLFCGCFGDKRETEVESVCYGRRQADEDIAEAKDEKMVFDKVVYFDNESKYNDAFLHFEAVDEDKGACFRTMWKRVRGYI